MFMPAPKCAVVADAVRLGLVTYRAVFNQEEKLVFQQPGEPFLGD